MKSIKLKFISAILASSVLFISAFGTAFATTDAVSVIDSISDRFLSLSVPAVGSIGGEWEVIGLARADKITNEFVNGYYSNAVEYVKAKGSNRLHRAKSTDNSRMIIALTSVGYDAQSVGGYDIVEPLADFSYVKAQGINGVIWALIALDTLGFDITSYDSYEDITTREKLIGSILSRQLASGGWSLSGDSIDVDITAMVITALAPYCKSDSDVSIAVDKALSALSEVQLEDGTFGSFGSPTSESCAQVVNALSAVDVDAETDTRFVKNGISVLSAMMSFAVEGGFSHIKNDGYNQMATEQCLYALVAYQRMKDGRKSLFDMSDLPQIVNHDVNADGRLNVNDCTDIQRNLAQITVFSAIQKLSADFDDNGTVTVGDVTLMQRYLTR